MAAYTHAQVVAGGNVTKNYKWGSAGGGAQIVVKSIIVNFDNIATAASSATLAASDTFQVLQVEPKETVLACGFNVVTAATGSCDFDMGCTSGDVDGFIDGIEANDTSPTVVAAPFGLLSGTRFASADTLDILALTASAAGAVTKFWALVLRVG